MYVHSIWIATPSQEGINPTGRVENVLRQTTVFCSVKVKQAISLNDF